ncbi:MAG TPA: GH92 family glycosyl hydrolase [Flavobacteriales bacterium]
MPIPFVSTLFRRHVPTLLLALLLGLPASAQTNKARELVNPFVGTGGHGHTFPGACVPNGLVQLSPDTRPDGYMDWDGCGGYHYSDSLIYGFSHTHLSGTGVADLCDVLLMPMSGRFSLDASEYRSSFDKRTEKASAGYYSVQLKEARTKVELTASERSGVHRYTFPENENAYVVMDLHHRDLAIEMKITEVGPTEIVGNRRSRSWAKDQQLFFCIRFSHPKIKTFDFNNYRSDIPADGKRILPELIALDFGVLGDAPLIVKVGISAVSIEGARANLEAEVPHWDFDQVRTQAEAAWNAKLDKIETLGGTPEQQRIFYTALYHSYVAPYVFSDVDGKYRGMDGQVHHSDRPVYTVFSLWDTFRALHPLMTILEPEMTSDWINTFLLHYKDGGRLPVWELWGNETDCMIGYHSVSVIADAYMKGIRGFDEKLALEAMVASAMRDEPGLNAYRAKGYISSEDAPESVSRTLEYAYDDWCIAQVAKVMLSKLPREQQFDPKSSEQYRLFMGRSQNWRNLLDPQTGFFRPRRNAGMLSPFDPYEVNFNYTEANAWQYSQFAPHDLKALDKRRTELGIAPRALLDSLFTTRSATTGRQQADITGLIGQYAHGNEPSHHMAYLYSALGKPERTRELVRSILAEQYHDAPDGLSGNEDCGQMSAWYVMSALGFYPVTPGDPTYTLGYPLFQEARIDLGQGKGFTVMVSDSSWAQMEAAAAKGKADDAPPVMDDGSRTRFEHRSARTITHAQVAHGGMLRFDRDRVPQTTASMVGDEEGRAPAAMPITPIIQAKAPVFRDSLEVSIISSGRTLVVLRTAKDTSAFTYKEPFMVHGTCSVEASSPGSAPNTARFRKIDGNSSITLETLYANQYAAGGPQALVDGIRGGTEFRTGEWQGFEGTDINGTIDLGAVRTLERVGLSVLQDPGAWIFYPSQVQFAWSTNGRTWSSATVENTVDRKAEGGQIQVLWTAPLNKQARYLKVIAKNGGPCPDWHVGRGGKTWIFSDEVVIEAK